MKYLAKAKPNNTLMGRTLGEFLDEYRYRVFSNGADIAQWKSRKVVDVKAELKDEATDEEFAVLYSTKGDDGIIEFINKYSLHKVEEPKEPVEEPKEPVEEPEEPVEEPKEPVEEKQVEPQKQVKKNKYKNR